jgi:regulator of sigma E protease
MILTAIVFFIILSILVFIHELGHYAVARWIGVHVEEFGFGLPPRMWGKKIGRTIYSLNWLPIGGFVKLSGEDDAAALEAGRSKKPANIKEYFFARSKKERAAILLAGVTMNFVLAVGITAYLLTQGIFEPTERVRVQKIVAGSPADKAGLQENDIIASVGWGRDDNYRQEIIHTPAKLISVTKEHLGEELSLTVVDTEGVMRRAYLTPRKEYPDGEGPMGVSISNLEEKKYSWAEAPGKALVMNLERARDMLVGIGTTLWRVIQFQSPGADVAGPIGIAQVTGQAVKFGMKAVLEFMAILSLNLAVLNILPIPALDGGRLLFVVLEKVMGRRVRPAFEQSTHQIGMILLLILIALISINDVLRLARGG